MAMKRERVDMQAVLLAFFRVNFIFISTQQILRIFWHMSDDATKQNAVRSFVSSRFSLSICWVLQVRAVNTVIVNNWMVNARSQTRPSFDEWSVEIGVERCLAPLQWIDRLSTEMKEEIRSTRSIEWLRSWDCAFEIECRKFLPRIYLNKFHFSRLALFLYFGGFNRLIHGRSAEEGVMRKTQHFFRVSGWQEEVSYNSFLVCGHFPSLRQRWIHLVEAENSHFFKTAEWQRKEKVKVMGRGN